MNRITSNRRLKLYVRLLTGPMKGGKTRNLVKYMERYILAKQYIYTISPKMDTRAGSHNSLVTQELHGLLSSPYCYNTVQTNIFDFLKEVKEMIDAGDIEPISAIFVDEFFMLEGWSKEFFYWYQQNFNDVPLTIAGIVNGWSCDTFKATSIVLPFVDSIKRERAICERCGKDANYFFYKGGVEAWNSRKDCIDEGCNNFECLCAECYTKATGGKPVYSDLKE